ncbi:hypothetical protein SAY86_002013 [Trapa natans]|uniref:protein-serine/threonine phosphatase n=1 Tax=Trapa natans TaxID=22666 RepID=A0AAN7LJJ7_TRANT|nr:hypothetical protein SAY86_002013 [Trapa natans]
MGSEEARVEDVEEGEISDSASVEEISAEDFNKQDVKAANEEAKAKSDSRVWTMQDLYKYHCKRGYSSGLYNLAWAQAVQNKPLREVFDLEAQQEDNSNSKGSSPNGKENKNNAGILKEGEKVVIDVTGDEVEAMGMDAEKEEGELEEGEIDLDWIPKACVDGGEEDSVGAGSLKADRSQIESREMELRQALESIISFSSEISFVELCTKVQRSLEDLQELFLVDCITSKDSLIQLFFAAVQALHNVFCCMDHLKKDQNKENWRRVLSLTVKDDRSFLPLKQLKEMEDMLQALDFPSVLSTTGFTGKGNNGQISDGLNGVPGIPVGHSVNALSHWNNAAEGISEHNRAGPSESLKQGFRGRGILAPLLDLHKDHDADSLPSPTREAPPTPNLSKSFSSVDAMFKPELGDHKLANGMQEFRIHPYETEAHKVLSSYQQKFGRSSSFTTDRLPSPTPSEENSCEGDDAGEEVSSSITGNSNTNVPGKFNPSLASHSDKVGMQGVTPAKNVPTYSVSTLPVKSLPKSRDPRLRFLNTDSGSLDLTRQASSLTNNFSRVEPFSGIIGSRKPRHIEDAAVDGPEPKKLKSEMGNSGKTLDVKTSSVIGGLDGIAASGWQSMNRGQTIETASDPRKMENKTTFPICDNHKPNVTVAVPDPLRGVSTTTAASLLPELLKGIAVNPSMLASLMKIGQQQKPAAENGPKNTSPLINRSAIAPAPPVSTAQVASGVVQKPPGILQAPIQNTSMGLQDDLGKIRMKPRDPRRILHGNMLQKNGSVSSEQITSAIPTPRPLVETPADSRVVGSQPVAAPDIAQQFTKTLKSLANIISVPQVLPSLPVDPIQDSSELEDKTKGSNSSEQQTGNGMLIDAGSSVPSQPQNSWGAVEHLFEGYDDQQKAAIQRERARRIEEQKKMFASHKLCLVLDLDHTLLNSAKFVEVDPVHDDILRKKEEQDKEKSQRHLFRFPHMGMWTKLRPGIWNFLEKASKLYELHLYTMGNKLYATEMAKVLDPKGVLFAGRVISRGDDGDSSDSDDRYPKSKDLEGVLGMESSVVIIDDSVRVWPHNKLNLIVVERYTYFPSSRRQFGLLGPSLLEIDHDERPEDGTLASSLAVIERIHQIFFSHQSLVDLDVRNILASEQQKILAGCRIVFSRVFPVGEANPHLHPLWQTAEQFGAVCTNQIDDQVTHVVANSPGTDKVNWALSTGRFVVHPGWVEASALLYRRANEQDFAIKL